MTTPKYDIDDITSDVSRLYELIDMVTDFAIDICPATLASSELTAKWTTGRLAALLWIARDLSEKIKNGLDNLPLMAPLSTPAGAMVGPDRGAA